MEMPSGVSITHAVEVGGKVYIGGGSFYKFLEYTIEGGQWRKIDTPVRYFGMAVVNDQIIIIGGLDMKGVTTDQVLESDSNTCHSLQCLQLGCGPQQS